MTLYQQWLREQAPATYESMQETAYDWINGGCALHVWASTGLITTEIYEQIMDCALHAEAGSADEYVLFRLYDFIRLEEFKLRRLNFVFPTDARFRAV